MFSLFPNKGQSRKRKTERILRQKGIKVNPNLPYVEMDKNVVLRSTKETAERVTALALTNLVAFNTLSGEDATSILKKFGLWELTTPNEKAFLNNPTDEQKTQETWKCEGIWTLLWALKKVDDLGFPDALCNLNTIDPESYPIGQGKDPNLFINAADTMRSKKEILDAMDFYYRANWACVDARLNGKEMQQVHPGIVYERHYALNWLVNYMGQDWDDISCDT